MFIHIFVITIQAVWYVLPVTWGSSIHTDMKDISPVPSTLCSVDCAQIIAPVVLHHSYSHSLHQLCYLTPCWMMMIHQLRFANVHDVKTRGVLTVPQTRRHQIDVYILYSWCHMHAYVPLIPLQYVLAILCACSGYISCRGGEERHWDFPTG